MSVKYSVCSLFMITFLTSFIYTMQLEALEDLEVSTDLALYSKYIWRGFKLDDDPVLQSGAYISGYGFGLSIWGSADLKSDDSLNSDEMNYSLNYNYSLEDRLDLPLSMLFGYTYYDFPPIKTNSQELFFGLSWDNPFAVSLTWYHDFEDQSQGGGKGDYIVVDLDRNFNLISPALLLNLSGHLGYNRKLFIDGDGGDIGLNVGLVFKISENCSLSPSLSYSVPFGGLSDSDDGNQGDEFFWGVILSLDI